MSIFVVPNNQTMKSSELHRMIKRSGWVVVRQVGSHVIYTKNGKSFAVPDHGSKEMKKGLAQKLIKEMGLYASLL